MESMREAIVADKITITRRTDGHWNVVAEVTAGDSVGTLEFILHDGRFSLQASYAPSRSYVWDAICETVSAKIVAYEFGMASYIQPVTQPDGSSIFITWHPQGDCDAAE